MTTKNQSDQIMSDLKDIINESLQTTNSGEYTPSSLNLKKFINEMLNASNYHPEIIKLLDPINEALNNGVKEACVINNLYEGAKFFAKAMPSLVTIANEIGGIITQNLDEINMVSMYESVASPALKSALTKDYNDYMSTHSLESKANLVTILESAAGMDNSARMMLGYLSESSVAYNPEVVNIYDQVDNVPTNESVSEDQKQALLEKMKEYVDSKINESNVEEKKSYLDIDNNIKLHETIQHLRSSVNNKALHDVLNLYEAALNDGCREEMLYETFMNKLNEEFSYWKEVSDQMMDMEKRISTHKTNISFTKILETMANDATWSYLIPVVEDTIVAYEENPNVINRNILMNHMRMYDSCPYVYDIIDIVNKDNSKEGLLMKESSQFLSQKAYLEDVYSPIQYIKENECIFNVENQFYVKKGKNIAKLPKEGIKNLSESFLTLAKIVNDHNVEISEAENKIRYYSEFGGTFEITEGKVQIGDNIESVDSLKNLNEMHVKYPDCTDIDFLTGAFLCENFNNIAKVDFVKKVTMNEDNGAKTLDVFRINKNIYVASHDNLNEEHTFYRNVKPMQVKNIINEHFGIDVGNLFEDLLPNQDQIKRELVLIKEEYENKITKLMELKNKYEDSLDEADAIDPTQRSLFENALVEINKELENAKKEFIKFQKKVDSIYEADNVDKDKVEGILNDAEEALSADDDIDDFNNDIPGDDDLDGSDEDVDGSDLDTDFDNDVDDDIDGSDFDFANFELDGSDDDEFTSSDGDDMTAPIGNDFDTDNTDLLSQDDNYDLDDKSSAPGLDFEDPELDQEYEDNEATNDVEDENLEDAGEEDDFNFDDDIDLEDDPFGKDTEALGVEGEPDEDLEGDNIAGNEEAEQVDDDADLDYANFKIVKVDFDVNMKTGEKKPTGKVIVIVPMVDSEGNKTSDTKNIDFYITDINGEKSAVLDSEGLTLEMYNAVCDAIKGSKNFEEVEPEAQTTEEDGDITDELLTDDDDDNIENPAHVDEPVENDDPVDTPDPIDTGSDEPTVLTIDDGIEPNGIDINDLSDDDDDIVDDDPIHSEESTEILDIVPKNDVDTIHESKKNKKGNKVNESFVDDLEDDDIDGDQDDKEDIDGEDLVDDAPISENQTDPIAVIKDVLESYIEDGGDAELGDINDYDVDGKDVSSINARIGDNDYTFFTIYEDIYCALTADFDANSQDIDTLEDWIRLDEDDDEAPMSANVEIAEGDTQAWVDFVTDVIKIETGDDVEYELQEVTDGDEEVEVPVEDDHIDEAKVVLKKKVNTNGEHDAKVKLHPNTDHRQTTWKEGDLRDDSYAHYERTNGTDQQRKQYVLLRKKAKKYGVSVNPPAQNNDPMAGGMM